MHVKNVVVLAIRFVDPGGNAIDISEATTMEITAYGEFGLNKVFTAQHETDGTDGWVVYTTDDADFVSASTILVEGFAEGPGYKLNTDPGEIVVKKNLPRPA